MTLVLRKIPQPFVTELIFILYLNFEKIENNTNNFMRQEIWYVTYVVSKSYTNEMDAQPNCDICKKSFVETL